MVNRNTFLESSYDEVAADLTPVEQPKTADLTPVRPTARGFAPSRNDVIQRATELDIDPKLALAFFSQESSGNWNSKDSPRGARGGMQVMPGTYKSMMGTSAGQEDPWNNMEAGLRYIRYGQDKLNTRDPRLLAAGYHAGYDRPELKKGIIPNTNDGMISTGDYADNIAARTSGKIPERTGAPGKSRMLIGKSNVDVADLKPVDPADLEALKVSPDIADLTPVSTQEQDDWDKQAAAQQAKIDNQPFWDRVTTAGAKGYDSMLQSLATARWAVAGGNAEQLSKDLAAKFEAKQKSGKTTGQKEIDAAFKAVTKAEGAWETTKAGAKAIGTVLMNPKDTAVEIVENAPNSLPTMAGGVAGVGIGGGIGAGVGATAVGVGAVPGAVTGMIIGGRSGMAVGTTATELGAEIEQMVSERLQADKKPATAQNILALLKDKQFQSDATERGLKKGLTVAAIDQLFLGFGGKIATAPARSIATKELADQGFDVSTRSARKAALATPAGKAALEAAKPSLGAKVAAGTAAVGVDAAGDSIGEGVVSLGQSAVETAAGVAIEKGKNFVTPTETIRPQSDRVEPTFNSPSDKAGPLERAAENAAVQPEKVTVNTPAGSVSGTVTGKAQDGTTQITGDDGQVYTFKVGENGITMTPEAPNTPLSNALEVAADDHAEKVAQAEAAPAPEAAAPEAATEPAPAPAPAPAAPVQADLTSMDEEGLRGRLKYIAEQAKGSGWDKRLMEERRRVEAEINKRQQAAPEAGQTVFDTMADANAGMLERATATGKPHEVVQRADGKFELKPITEQAPVKPVKAPPAAEQAPASALPKDLAGAKPRYNYGNKAFELKFENDIDRAAFIAAQDKPSKRDADYLAFAMQATGMSEDEVRAHGQAVRNAIKAQAKDASPGTLKVPTVERGSSAVLLPQSGEKPASGRLPAAPAAATSAQTELAAEGRQSGAPDNSSTASGQNKPGKLKFRAPTAKEKSVASATGAIDLGNGSSIIFADSLRDVYIHDAEGNETSIRQWDKRAGSISEASQFPVSVPEALRQPLIDYQDALHKSVTGTEEAKAALEAAREKVKAVVNQEAETQEKPAKPKTASKEDVEHLFGTDKKRAAALERIAKGTAYFGSKDKAQDFITKNGLKDTHEVVQTGKVRFEVMEKQANGAKQTKTDIITEHRVTSAEGKPATLIVKREKSDPTKIAQVKIKAEGEPTLTLGAQGVVSDEQLIKNLTDTDIINGSDNGAAGQRNSSEAMPRQDFDSTAGVGKISAVKERYSDKFGVSWASTNIASADSMEEAAAIAKAVAESGADNIAAMREAAKNIQGASNVNDNSTAGQRNGAEAVGEEANAGQTEAAPVQPGASKAQTRREVKRKKLESADDWWTGANKSERVALLRKHFKQPIVDGNSPLEWNELGEGMQERIADILIDKEQANAAKQVNEQAGVQSEHRNGNEGGQAAEASGGDSLQRAETGSEGNASAQEAEVAQSVSPLTQARNDLIELRTEVEQQGQVVDDRLLERVRRQEKLVADLESEQNLAKEPDASAELMDRIVGAYGFDDLSKMPAGLAKTATKLRDALVQRDSGMLQQILHPSNQTSRKAFEALFGQTLPKTVSGTDAVIAKFIGAVSEQVKAEVTPAETTAPAAQFADNKIFTQDAVDRARARLKSKLNQLNSGIDPEMMIDGMTIAGAYIEAGLRDFSAYAKAMTEDFGDKIKPYLLSFYEGARNYPGIDTTGMTAQDEAKTLADALVAAKEKANEPETLDQPSAGALERAQTDLFSGAEPNGQVGRGAERGGRSDTSGNERAGAGGLQQSGRVGNDAGDVPVSSGRTRKGRGGEQGSGAVQRSERSAKRDPAVDAGGSDLLTPTDGQRAQDRASDFQITSQDEIGEGGAKTKFKQNIAAIRLLKQLQAENRNATREEQAVLAKYVGWGGLPQAFYRDNNEVTKGWEREAAELKELLTEAELAAAASSTRNAHYTSPEIVKGMWEAAKHFGFQGGRVLEPSVGVGNFFGLMPKDLRAASALNGVELDHITGGLAQKLYPQANIAAAVGFQDYSAPDNYFDLAIGNPPFGREGIYDANRRKISGFSIHNYFFAKSIDTVKPNGVLAMVVTNRLLDSAGDKARQYIADRAEFLGAIRLPNNAFLKNAGTEVTTDIIFLRKLSEGEQPKGQRWMDVKTITDKAGKDVPLNEYFIKNPDMMLGEFGAYGSMYSPDEPALVARDGQDTAAMLQEVIKKLPSGFMDAPTAEPVRETITPAGDISAVKIGSVFVQDGEVYERREDMLNEQQAAPVTFANEKAKERVLGMIGVRDALATVRSLQLSDTAKDSEIEAARAELNRVYDAFVKANAPLNTDANKRLMRDDPSWPQIAALEDHFDKGISPAVAKSTGEKTRPPSAKKAAIFTKRTQAPYHAPEKATSAKDALVSSLAERGRVDLDYMAKLYGQTPDAIVKELGSLVFNNPHGGWETREQYLSGNVKQKLAQALEAVKTDSSLKANVEELRAVQPADIEAVDIDVKPGAHWIPADVMQDFVKGITEAGKTTALYNPVNAQWTLTAESLPASAQTQWGTDRARAINVIEAAANQKQIQIFDQHSDGSRTLNERETTAANEKVERVKAEWRRWIWEDDGRRERLARIYNDTFNTDVARDYDGSHLTFPGKVGDDIITLRPHQKNAVWRMIQSGTTLLDHVVGAGKTFTIIAGVMEMRRMGLAKKPTLMVPNHLVGQWAEDFMKLYPGANILAATKRDFEKDNRKKLFARIATGDWDAVIVAHSSFGKVEVEPEFQESFIKQQIADMDTSISAMRAAEGKGSRNVKQIEKQKAALEEKLKRLFDTGTKDDNLYFSELGIDGLFLDEAHEFKNLGFSTGMQRVAGLGNPTGSNKAADLFMKVRAVLKRTNGRNVVFATGTPISNTMAEMYTMQRYLDYDTLKAQGIAHFDAWAKTFGEVVTDWELSPSGQYKMNSRFAKFVNMPELMQRYQSFADVINRDDINRQLAAQGKKLPVPKLKGGKPENVIVARSNDQAQYIGVPTTDAYGNEVYPEGSLIWRSEHLPKKAEKGADNMLKIMSDARKAALDMRLIDPSYPDNAGSKVNEAADRIKKTYDQWEKDKGAQLVFIDLSTPKGAVAKEAARLQELVKAAEEGDEAAQEKLDAMSPDELMALESGQFSVYDDLKAKLIARGIPEKEIAFIHDANTEQQKEDLFGKVRSGRVRVLFGSTAKMGAGMNVQERLVALHHLDAPWRPSDLEQREGRIIRQGNALYEADPENFEVEINRYATKQTLDSRMWQTIEAKARFIEQVRKGAGSREIEDVAGEAANSAEMKAASSGNPLILEEMTLRQQIRKLDNQQAEHAREQHRIRDRIRMLGSMAEKQDRDAAEMEQDAKRVPETFEAKIGKETFEKHGEAGEAILAAVDAMYKAGEDSRSIGTYGGFTLELDDATGAGKEKSTVLTIKGEGEYQISADPGSNATGLALRLQNTVKGLATEAKQTRALAEKNRSDIPKLESQIKPWGQDQELADAKARHAAVIDQLRPKKKEQEQAAEGGEKPAFSRAGSDLESIFNDLDGRGKVRAKALAEIEKRPDGGTIQYIEQNFWNILSELEERGVVDIKC